MNASLLGAFVLTSILLVITPGPATLYVLRRYQGPLGDPIKAVAGIVAGDIILIGLSGIGVAALVMQFPELASAMKLAGAGYIAWVGWSLLTRSAEGGDPHRLGRHSSLAGGLLITLSNPKAILFFAAFFPLFMDERAPIASQFIWLAAIFEAVNLVYFALLIAAARHAFRRIDARRSMTVRIAAGIGLLAAASLSILLTLEDMA